MNRKIESIKIGTGEFDTTKGHNIKNALVKYEDGSVEKIEDFAEIQKAVQRLATQEGKTIEELAASGDKLTEEPIVTEKEACVKPLLPLYVRVSAVFCDPSRYESKPPAGDFLQVLSVKAASCIGQGRFHLPCPI